MTRADDHDAVTAIEPMTGATRRIIALARSAGLDVRLGSGGPVADQYGRVGIVIDSKRRDGLFGVIYVSAVTGRIISAYLVHGNDGSERRYDGSVQVRSALRSWIDT